MSEYKTAFDIITSGTIDADACLTSVFEIENILLHIQELNSKITHLKGLKKYRVESADVEIDRLEEQVRQCRELIKTTMITLEPKEKTLQFPSVAKVTRREDKGGWDIADEEKFLKFVEEQGKKDLIVKTKEVVDKKMAKKLISQFIDNGIDVPGTIEIPPSVSLSITFDEEDVPKLSSATIKKPSKAKISMDDKKSKTKTVQTLDDLRDDLESLEV